MALTEYKSSLETEVTKDSLTGKYTISTSIYSFYTKVKEDSTEYEPEIIPTPIPEPEPEPEPEPTPVTITGIYQQAHPSTYLTDTSVQDAPVDLTGNNGLKNVFANCEALTAIDLSTDVSNASGTDNSNAFYGCTALTTITGTIDLTDVPYNGMKDMFKDCTSLTAVSIKNGADDNDITAENVEVAGVTYDYAYEILGLTAEQFASAVTLVTE